MSSAARPLWVGGPTALPLGVGVWAWGDTGYWGYGQEYGETEVAGAYEASRAAGLTLFDTAELYGRGTSERLLGRLIRDEAAGSDALVATKFAGLPWRVGRRGPLLDALQGSFDRLRMDRVALYQIHFPPGPLPDRAWLADLATAYERGLIGAVGVSNYGPRQMRAAHRVLAQHGVPLATNQVQYSLLARRPETTGLTEVCRELGVTLIAYSPLAQGLLTGKYTREKPPPGVRGLRFRASAAKVAALVEQLTAIGAAHDRTPGQVALAWLVAKGAVPIPGAKTADQARHNAGAVGWDLTPDEVAALDHAGR